MKAFKSKFSLFVILIILSGNQIAFAWDFTSPGEFGVSEYDYVNNMDTTWTIDLETNRPVLFNIYISIEDGYDFLYFYAIDHFGNDILVNTVSGNAGYQTFSTMIPSGKAKVVFITNDVVNYNNGWAGFGGTFDVDNNPSIDEIAYNAGNSYTVGDSYFMGKVGIGTATPTKKVEIWDGSSGKFTFSAANCTSGYETAHTIDNTGYKININNSVRDFRVAVSSVDKFKILKNENYAMGTNALLNISSGYNNFAVGSYALRNITTGYGNFGVGSYSLYSNTTGGNNTGVGSYSLYANTSGSYNIAMGLSALRTNSSASYNIALGPYSLYYNTTGYENMAMGVNSLYSNTLGRYNIAFGSFSLHTNTTGIYNIGVGHSAGRYITNGSTGNLAGTYSVFIGAHTKAKADSETNQIVIGYNAIGNGSNTVTLGNDNIVNTILKGKVGIGYTNPQYLLDVKGTIHAMEVKIEASTSFPDYVFADDYELMSLSDLNNFISTNRHLPGIPSAGEAQENGVNVGEMQEKLLKKIEELTLYIIDQQKEIDELKKSLEK